MKIRKYLASDLAADSADHVLTGSHPAILYCPSSLLYQLPKHVSHLPTLPYHLYIAIGLKCALLTHNLLVGLTRAG